MTIRLEKLIGRAVQKKRRRRFTRDESGVTAIEFGLLALPFFSIIGAILETSIVFMTGQVLESAVQDVTRLIRTGQAQAATMTPAGFKAAVCDRVYGLFNDCTGANGMHVEVRVVDKFADVNMTPPVKASCAPNESPASCSQWTRPEVFLPGVGSSIVTVQVYYQWPLVLSMDWLGLSNLPSGKRLLGAATVFRNEPFTS